MPIARQRKLLFQGLRSLPLAAAVALGVGCSSRPKPPAVDAAVVKPPVQMLQKPAIDLSRGVAGFPLEGRDVPKSPGDAIESLRRAYANRLEGQNDIRIDAVGQHLMDLQSLTIDLTGSTVRSTYTPKDQAKTDQAKTFILADRLAYIANPLKYQGYAAGLEVAATNAELTLIPTVENQWTLVLSDCHTGSARLRVGLEDLRQGILAAARQRQSVAFGVQDLAIDLASPTSRSLRVAIDVQARLFFVPARFTIRGKAAVDEQFNVHFSELSADGHDPSGAIVANFVQDRLQKYNDKAAPLVKLPGGKIHLTGLMFDVTDELSIDVNFAGTGR